MLIQYLRYWSYQKKAGTMCLQHHCKNSTTVSFKHILTIVVLYEDLRNNILADKLQILQNRVARVFTETNRVSLKPTGHFRIRNELFLYSGY